MNGKFGEFYRLPYRMVRCLQAVDCFGQLLAFLVSKYTLTQIRKKIRETFDFLPKYKF